jgi:hypothetical protein
MDMDFEQPVAVDPPNLTWPHRVVGLGVASLILLVLCLLFAHHWNVVTLTLVTAWAVCVLGALIGGLRLAARDVATHLAHLALALAAVSVLALIIAGIAYAAGGDPAGACGGG